MAYKGDFQWTVEGSKRKDMSEMDGQEEDTTLKEIKQSLNNVHDDNPEAPITIPSSTNTHNTASIVEVSSTKQSPVHQFTAEEDNNIRVLTVHLPLEESSAEFELTAGEQDLQLETPNYALQLRLPCKDSSIDAKFDVYSKLLTVKLLN